jgi:hypothetical protein
MVLEDPGQPPGGIGTRRATRVEDAPQLKSQDDALVLPAGQRMRDPSELVPAGCRGQLADQLSAGAVGCDALYGAGEGEDLRP